MKIKLTVLFFCNIMLSSLLIAGETTDKPCETFIVSSGFDRAEAYEAIKQWETELGSVCKDTVAYYHSKGWKLVIEKDYQSAEEVFTQGAKLNPDYKAQFLANIANIYYEKWLDDRDGESIKISIDKFEKLLKDHPDYYYGYFHLSTVYLSIEDFRNAYTYAEKSLELMPSYEAYRNAIVALYQLDRYEETIALFDQAYAQGNSELVFDKVVMISLASAYENKGEAQNAMYVLALLFDKVPSIENDKDFLAFLTYLKEKYGLASK